MDVLGQKIPPARISASLEDSQARTQRIQAPARKRARFYENAVNYTDAALRALSSRLLGLERSSGAQFDLPQEVRIKARFLGGRLEDRLVFIEGSAGGGDDPAVGPQDPKPDLRRPRQDDPYRRW